MRRRAFIAALGSAAAWPLMARALQSGKIPRIGVLWHTVNGQDDAILLSALQHGLADHGYIEGKNIEVLNRFAGGHYDRFEALAKDLIDANVDVIVASVGPSALGAKRASATTPVVFVGPADAVGGHLVDSLAHPGGNLTGFSTMMSDAMGKRLQLLKDCLTRLSSVVLLYNPSSPVAAKDIAEAQAAARSLNAALSFVEVRAPNELEQAFLVISQRQPDAVIIGVDAMLYNERKRIAGLAVQHRVPTFGGGEAALAGMLMSYGPDLPDLFRRAADYVDKILKGAQPGDLPVEQPTKFRFLVNLQTASEIGVTIPVRTQLLADQVIEASQDPARR
jgi:putative ABC transport system substrate-binding protein